MKSKWTRKKYFFKEIIVCILNIRYIGFYSKEISKLIIYLSGHSQAAQRLGNFQFICVIYIPAVFTITNCNVNQT